MNISGKFWSSRFGRTFVDWVSFTFFLESPPVGGNGLGPTNGQHLFLGHQGTTPK